MATFTPCIIDTIILILLQDIAQYFEVDCCQFRLRQTLLIAYQVATSSTFYIWGASFCGFSTEQAKIHLIAPMLLLDVFFSSLGAGTQYYFKMYSSTVVLCIILVCMLALWFVDIYVGCVWCLDRHMLCPEKNWPSMYYVIKPQNLCWIWWNLSHSFKGKRHQLGVLLYSKCIPRVFHSIVPNVALGSCFFVRIDLAGCHKRRLNQS